MAMKINDGNWYIFPIIVYSMFVRGEANLWQAHMCEGDTQFIKVLFLSI